MPRITSTRAEALRAINEASASLSQLQKIHANTVRVDAKMSAIYQALSKGIDAVGRVTATSGASKAQLFQAVRQLQEAQLGYNLQWLQLQQQMQSENRDFTVVSNVLKTKHDTVKNSISNIR